MSAVSSESPLAAADLSAPSANASTAQSAGPPGHDAADFGANEWLVDELYQRYLADPGSVDRAWWSFFADYRPTRGNGTGPQPAMTEGNSGDTLVAPPPAPGPSAPSGPASPSAPRARRRQRPRRAKRRRRPSGAAGPAARYPAARGRRARQAARRRRPHRAEHGGQPLRSHRHQRPRVPGQAAYRQPHRHQQPPAARQGREGLLHPPDRLRRRPGRQADARDERRVRRGGRQAGPRDAAPHQPRPGHRPAEQGRQPPAPGAEHQGRRRDGLPPVLDGVRGRGPQGAQRQAHRRRLPGHHDLPDQPGHHRHRAFRAAPDAGSGLHRRRRRHGIPRRLPGRERGDHGAARDQQDGHAHLHLRPPDHPGRPVRGIPAGHPPSAARRGRLLRRALRELAHPLRAGALGQGLPLRA